MSEPLVSVVVPAYNCERFLAETVGSILEQRVQPVEVIVVDDGSTDSTAMVAARSGPVRVIRRDNGGPGAARNTGLELVGGQYVAFLDGDDVWPAGSLQRRLDVLASQPSAGAVMGRTHAFVRRGGAEGAHDAYPFGEPIYGAFLSAVLLRREVVDAVGPFDPNLRISEDYDWLARVRELGVQLALIDDVVHLYRRHDTNLTIGVHGSDSNIAAVLKRSLDRRRATDGRADHLRDMPFLGEGSPAANSLRLANWEERQ